MKNLTIKDLAKKAGISPSTVSRILNKSGYYSRENEKTIMKLVEETGFVYNSNAKRLRYSRSFTIGFVIPDISNDFYSKIALIVDSYFSKLGYSLYICNTNSDPAREFSIFQQLASNQVDGIICIALGTEIPSNFTAHNIPIVALDREFYSPLPVTRVLSDEYNLGRIVAEHMLDAGCNNIKVIAPSMEPFASNTKTVELKPSRIDGFFDTLVKTKPSASKNNSLINTQNLDNQILSAQIAVEKLLENNIDFDGIFALSDRIAFGALRALKLAGIRIPEDVKIVGFDNNFYSANSLPTITSVERNLDEMAKTACDKLLEKISCEEKFKEETIIIPGNIVVRESSQ